MFSRKSSYKLTTGLFLALSTVSCQKKDSVDADPARLGRTLYAIHCASCHSPNPSRDGSLGPALKGSSPELIRAKVQRGEYPTGYIPKRTTKIMQRLPLSDADLSSIHAYLNGS